ncbi:hypothetical protein CHLRE_12g531000v5 [Chlamydomonas reinhardtii]|uniref:Putative ammonium transporter n=1 Tax=Chlamydomonas reinhardtii TaxID=3055 RepID=Q6QBS7_CHLRE|nr:uncharacterized protein CHLRE_12g531000v5 [Chlamydomonas reinhardtii]XP_042918660.1 uncharacterized protein CHLRE_12g531000v5 [Chlamydomonas reinhardtii]AAS54905.1 putative ammonium transporter [Chlamydomonas reinhardtii]PNW75546.1 hypothetical protein CHLRE_12g531000v5 [Chlamydomonas reinhardtii]PNW75547.1 hypothetical protein CHLRE_12g531000v5 [Chlamydomonas reinhardtii]|eukprot:XP_001692923.1 ammonium transporter [Chlamydomonas reinhardtii]
MSSTPSATAIDHGATYSDLLIIQGAIVFFLQVGFVSLEVGYGRSKNVKNILLKNTVNILLCAICWWAVGYAFSYGSSTDGFIGTSGFFHDGGLGAAKLWFYSWTFCLSTVTIVSGCLAERTSLVAYPVFTVLMASWVHPVVVHWAWSRDSWLLGISSECRFLDFAGGTVVHICGGMMGLVGAALVGPRIGRFEEGRAKELPGHDVSSVAIGTLFLWFGWFGFNCGSAYVYMGNMAAAAAEAAASAVASGDTSADVYASAAAAVSAAVTSGANATLHPGSTPADRVALNMTLCASVSGLTALLLSSLRSGTVDLCVCCNSLLAGLVMSTPACGFITSWAAVIYGLVAAALYMGGTRMLVRFHVDDPLESSAIHFGCGGVGTLLLALLARPTYVQELTGYDCGGLVYGGRKGAILLGLQLLGIAAITAWTAFFSVLVFYLLRRLGRLRVDQVTELAGLDNMEHGGPAYPEFNLVPYNTGSAER